MTGFARTPHGGAKTACSWPWHKMVVGTSCSKCRSGDFLKTQMWGNFTNDGMEEGIQVTYSSVPQYSMRV